MPERMEAVQRAAGQWQDQLIDVSGRNRLLNYSDLKVGTLDLTPDGASGICVPVLANLLAGSAVRMTGLFPVEESRADARKRLSALQRRTQEHLDEKGLSTLFVAVGLATWTAPAGSPPNAPVILVPLAINPDDAGRLDFSIELAGEPHVNPMLAHIFRTEYGIDQSDAADDLAEDLPTSLPGLQGALERLGRRWDKVPGLAITNRIVMGNFSYTNMPMVADLENNLAAFAANDFVAAVAGVAEARAALAARIRDPSPNQPDIDPPESEFLVVDADASQHRAINRVLAGESLVIWGPPGTGKSQTIANLIAALIAQGKRALFVAEKRAAIDVVVARLQRAGLSDLIMDAHGGIKSKREFARSMADSMRNVRSIRARDYSGLHTQLSERRSELVAHNNLMHGSLEPWQVSPFEVQQQLIDAAELGKTAARMSPEKARELNRERMNRLMQAVQDWVDLEGHRLRPERPEWAQANINTAVEAQEAFFLVREISARLPDVRRRLFAALTEVGLGHPDTVSDWSALLQYMSDVEQFLSGFHPNIYELDHSAIKAALAPANRWWESLSALFSPGYRKAMKSVRAALRDGENLSGGEALSAVAKAADQVLKWREAGGNTGHPRLTEDLAAALTKMHSLMGPLEKAAGFFPSENLTEKPGGEVVDLLNGLAGQVNVAANLPRIRELEREFADAGVDGITAAVGSEIPPEKAAEAVEQRWLKAVWDDMLFRNPNLAGFTGAAHNHRQQEFIGLDKQHLDTAPQRIKRAVAEAAIEAMNAHPGERALVAKEAAKSTRHLPVRRLFNCAPHVLTALRPCWTMSPLLVAELIPAAANLFDVVIFDEASQIPPAEAIGSLARAPQAVIAGDDRQLPPTSFFGRRATEESENEEDDTDTALTSDIESILDVAKAGPIREELLQWHYRSRDARLIAFSNANFYGEALTAFPGTAVAGPITHHLVPFRALPQRSNRSHPDEVERVVDMIVDHARQRPGESLGVITFGIAHADNIDEALRMRLRSLNDRELDGFFAEKADERFFVKNIERVQGDERDVIILSVGYHKASNGALPYRFGPLNQDGGERRLNVAITRARSRVHLVSSFSHHDMEPGRSNALGVELLRQYLEFAAAGGSELGATVSDVSLNPFELDVRHRLEDKGIPVTPQYGVAGYRIDFACAHPDQPGRMVLAIEADGASYHSAHTARERDRLRQQVLEDKGWRFHRIWSTDWFRNRDAEVNRAVAAWRQAVSDADGGNAATVNSNAYAPPIAPPASPIRGPRPDVPPNRGDINKYSPDELVALARWIMSDSLLRTDDELQAEMRSELGFQRKGSRIDAALQSAITLAKGHSEDTVAPRPQS